MGFFDPLIRSAISLRTSGVSAVKVRIMRSTSGALIKPDLPSSVIPRRDRLIFPEGEHAAALVAFGDQDFLRLGGSRSDDLHKRISSGESRRARRGPAAPGLSRRPRISVSPLRTGLARYPTRLPVTDWGDVSRRRPRTSSRLRIEWWGHSCRVKNSWLTAQAIKRATYNASGIRTRYFIRIGR